MCRFCLIIHKYCVSLHRKQINQLVYCTKVVINMETKAIQIRKSKNITDILRGMDVGEIISIKGRNDSVKQIALRLKKEGMRFSTSVKGMSNGIKIERVE